MKEVSIVCLDLTKRVFQLHAASADGGLISRRKLSRFHCLAFFSELPRWVVAMEACAPRITGLARSGSLAMKFD